MRPVAAWFGPIRWKLAPAPAGQLQFLAGTSIYDSTSVDGTGNVTGVQLAIDISGAATAPGDIATSQNPSFTQGPVIPHLF